MFKRVGDLLVTVAVLPIALPVLALVALAVALGSKGPVFHAAERLGRGGRRFRCWKFRTMEPDAEARLSEVLERDPAARVEYERYHKLRYDPRVTRVGRWLRRTSLDELPQILNVLLGDMSLVGPRPYLPRERPKMEPHAEAILSCLPGITGLWQVHGRSGTDFTGRLQMDLRYLERWSLWLDLALLVATVKRVVSSRDAY